MSKKISMLLLLLSYALVLVHSVTPHEHLHKEVKSAEHHSHDNHSHAHEGSDDAGTDTENPFSHYFHSLAQGEPHFPGKEKVLISKASIEARVEEQVFNFNCSTYYTLLTNTSTEVVFHSPPDTHHFSRRGPPLA
jgi:hypothetical protein